MELDEIKPIHFIRVFILIVLPFILGGIMLPHRVELTGSSLIIPSQIRTEYLQNEQYQFAHSYHLQETPAQINTIFPFADYLRFAPLVSYEPMQLCFEDTGSSLRYKDGTVITPRLSWNIQVNERNSITVPQDSIRCAYISQNQDYALTWNANFSSTITKQNLSESTFTPSIVAYPTTVMDYGVLQGIIFIPAFYLFIFYPGAGIIRKIQKGMIEQ